MYCCVFYFTKNSPEVGITLASVEYFFAEFVKLTREFPQFVLAGLRRRESSIILEAGDDLRAGLENYFVVKRRVFEAPSGR